MARRVVIDRGASTPRTSLAAAAHRVLQKRDRLGVPLVVLAVAPPRVEPDDRQQLAAPRVRARVPDSASLGELGKPDAADARRRAREVPVDELGESPTASKICAPQ